MEDSWENTNTEKNGQTLQFRTASIQTGRVLCSKRFPCNIASMKYVFWFILIVNSVKYGESETVEDEYQNRINSKGNAVSMDKNNFKIMCMKTPNLYSFERFNYTHSFVRVVVVWCVPPENSSYSEFLHSLNIDVNKVKIIHLMHNAPLQMTKTLFIGLKIEELYIENEGLPTNVNLTNDFLEPLDTLKTLTVDNVVFPPLPKYTNITKIVLRNGISSGDIGYCSNLKELHLIYWSLPIGPGNWLRNCSNLINLRFERMTLVAINIALMGLTTIQTLILTRCDLVEIPREMLEDAKKLQHLEITYNYIQNIRYDDVIWLQSLTKLVTLDLSYNEIITGLEVLFVTDMKSPKTVQIINLSHNPNLLVCRNEINPQDFYGFKTMQLQRLSLAATNMSKLCFRPLTIENLKYLDLVDNKITTLKYKQLPLSHTHYTADLRRNPLQSVEFGPIDYKTCAINNGSNFTNATVLMDSSIDCDCQHGWFAKALREKCLLVKGAICKDKTEITLKSPEDLECDQTIKDGCVFRETWKDAKVIVTCRGEKINRLPIRNRIKEIYAADNDIENITVENLPSTLQFLDLRKNSISRVDNDVARILFDHSRHLLLYGNPILCSCNNKYFIEELQAHHLQVDDYNNLTCAGEFRLIRDVIPQDLCTVLLLLPMVLSGSLIFLALVGYIFYRMYWQDVKMFLFTHGWCLWCVHEEDLDADRKYDAFISFCHQDYQFVNEQLLETLEPDYQLCIHHRDWLVGEWIPAQIQMSVQLSKRTIVVLSQLYLQSVWGMFEFRMAFALALKEGRNRLIVIILDDALDADMPPDLRHFVSNNTYLKWGDPWFWQKLKYVLPHKTDGDKNIEKPQNEVRRNHFAIKPAETNISNSTVMVDIIE